MAEEDFIPKKRCFNTSMPYNDKENSPPRCSTSIFTEDFNVATNTPQIPAVIENENTRLLRIILENQRRMQIQLNELQNISDQHRGMDKMIRECMVMSKETYKTVKKLFGEGLSQLEEEMGSLLPISTSLEAEELHIKLAEKSNEAAMKTYLISKKGNLPLDSLFRNMATDDFIDDYNWDGRCGKKQLKKLKLFGVILSDVYCNLDKKDFELQVRKSVELAHNRSKQRRINKLKETQ